MVPPPVVIATRKSPLALWQARHVQQRLQQLYPQKTFSILPLTTRGDEIQDRSLADVGGKGLFVKELEVALLDGRAQMAVHSLKDVPASLVAPYTLGAILKRDSPWDVFISPHGKLSALPRGARLGTSSLRRCGQMRAAVPHLTVVPMRGNVETRLQKMQRGDCDALVLAAAGLARLGLQQSHEVLPASICLPAVAQGALGIEILMEDVATRELLWPLHHEETARCVGAERAFSAATGGNCQLPLAGLAQLDETDSSLIHLEGLITDPQGTAHVRRHLVGTDPQRLGETLAAQILQAGGAAILSRL